MTQGGKATTTSTQTSFYFTLNLNKLDKSIPSILVDDGDKAFETINISYGLRITDIIEEALKRTCGTIGRVVEGNHGRLALDARTPCIQDEEKSH